MDSSGIALDPNGVAVAFSLDGHPLIFNGHNGLFLEDVPDRVLAYARGEAMNDADMAELVESGWKEWLDSYREGWHPDLEPEERQARFVRPASFDKFTITVAQACNLGCSYCINQQGTFGQRSRVMTEETARDIATFLRARMREDDCKRMGLILFGGEPMMVPRGVQSIAEALLAGHEETGKHITCLLCTNGTYWDDAVFDLFARHADKLSVAISIDGTREIHDRNRPFVSSRGGSSYDKAVATVERLVKMGIKLSVTCVAPAPYDFIGMAEHLHALGVNMIEMKQVVPYVHGAKDKPDIMRTEFEGWRRSYLAYTDWCVEKGGLLPPGGISHVDRISLVHTFSDSIDAVSSRRLGCKTGDGSASIDVEGTIFSCDAFIAHPHKAIGTVKTGLDRERAKTFEAWLLDKGQMRVDAPKCRSCFAKRFCGGGCYAAALDGNNEMAPLPDEECAVVRERTLIDLHYIARMKREHPDVIAEQF